MKPTRRWWELAARSGLSQESAGATPVASSLFLLAQSVQGRGKELRKRRHARLDSEVFSAFKEARVGAQPLLEQRPVVERHERVIGGEEGREVRQAAANS